MATFPFSLPLNDIIPVTVVISPVLPPGPAFNQALIVGPSTRIPSTTRCLQFSSLAQLTQASGTFPGFLLTDPEYMAAEIYYAQQPTPTYLWIGRQDLTALGAATVAAGGNGYAVGDVVTVTEAGDSTAQLQVVAAPSGVVTQLGLVPGKQGTGYTVSATPATTAAVTGAGTGLTVNITAVGETPAQALAACRNASPQWYACAVVSQIAATTATAASGASTLTVALATNIAVGQAVYGVGIQPNTVVSGTYVAGSTSVPISLPTTAALGGGGNPPVSVVFYTAPLDQSMVDAATFIEAAQPPSIFFLTSNSASILNNTANNLFAVLQKDGFNRTAPFYSTTQQGVFPNNLFAGIAAMGYAMGANSGTAGSYFTMMFKSLVGIAPDPLTQSQANTISGPPDRSVPGLNGNIYVNYANGSYVIVQNGTMASGRFIDIEIFLDLLVSQLQYDAMNLLVSQPAIPLTQAGIAQMIGALTQACVALQAIGFIATAGIWQGPTIGTWTAGTPMPKGFAVYSPQITTLTQAQRSARQFPHMNVLIILAEAGQSLAISVNVQF